MKNVLKLEKGSVVAKEKSLKNSEGKLSSPFDLELLFPK